MIKSIFKGPECQSTYIDCEQKATNSAIPAKEYVYSNLGGIHPLLLDKMEGVKGKQHYFVFEKTKNSSLVFDQSFTPSIEGSTSIGEQGKVQIQGGSV